MEIFWFFYEAMRRISILLLFSLLLFSFQCEPEIEFRGNQRLLFEGRVVDIQGNPIRSVPVRIYASRNFFDTGDFYASPNDELLGEAFTDAKGTFSFITLSPSNALNIYALINNFNMGFQANSTPIVINGINFLENDDLTFDLDELTVEQLKNFEFRVERQNSTSDTLEYTLRYKPEIKNINFNPNDRLEPLIFYDFPFNRTLLPTENEQESRFKVRESDTIFMEYRLRNSEISEVDSLQIIVRDNDNGFVFGF